MSAWPLICGPGLIMWGINMCVMGVYDNWAHDTLEQLHCLYDGIAS